MRKGDICYIIQWLLELSTLVIYIFDYNVFCCVNVVHAIVRYKAFYMRMYLILLLSVWICVTLFSIRVVYITISTWITNCITLILVVEMHSFFFKAKHLHLFIKRTLWKIDVAVFEIRLQIQQYCRLLCVRFLLMFENRYSYICYFKFCKSLLPWW